MTDPRATKVMDLLVTIDRGLLDLSATLSPEAKLHLGKAGRALCDDLAALALPDTADVRPEVTA